MINFADIWNTSQYYYYILFNQTGIVRSLLLFEQYGVKILITSFWDTQYNNISRFIVSKTFDKSKNIPTVVSFLSTALAVLSTNSIIDINVEWFGLKPNCFSFNKLFLININHTSVKKTIFLIF